MLENVWKLNKIFLNQISCDRIFNPNSKPIALLTLINLIAYYLYISKIDIIISNRLMVKNMKVKAIIHKAEEGGYWAEVPIFQGCYTQGETMECA